MGDSKDTNTTYTISKEGSDGTVELKGLNDCTEDYASTLLDSELSETSQDIYLENPIIMDEGMYAESKEFQEGFDIAAKYAGMFSCFVSNGMSIQDSVAMIFNLQNIEMNVKLSEISKITSIEVSKNQAVLADKQSL